jgi:hypothetical protein
VLFSNCYPSALESFHGYDLHGPSFFHRRIADRVPIFAFHQNFSAALGLKHLTGRITSIAEGDQLAKKNNPRKVKSTGFAACDFTQSIGAELLVVPAPEHVEGAVPSMMDWALQVTPCSLWIVRET